MRTGLVSTKRASEGSLLVLDESGTAASLSLHTTGLPSCERRGLSISVVRGGTGGAANCLRMAQPLTVSDDEIDLSTGILDSSLAALHLSAPR